MHKLNTVKIWANSVQSFPRYINYNIMTPYTGLYPAINWSTGIGGMIFKFIYLENYCMDWAQILSVTSLMHKFTIVKILANSVKSWPRYLMT